MKRSDHQPISKTLSFLLKRKQVKQLFCSPRKSFKLEMDKFYFGGLICQIRHLTQNRTG
jgi:hypothetical protein